MGYDVIIRIKYDTIVPNKCIYLLYCSMKTQSQHFDLIPTSTLEKFWAYVGLAEKIAVHQIVKLSNVTWIRHTLK